MFRTLPPATRAIILTNALVYLLQRLTHGAYDGQFALQPLGPYFEPWQLLTYAFLHGSVAHIFFNMFAVFMFGSELERFAGTRRYVVLYLASVLGAAGVQLATTAQSGLQESTIGASGGVFGLLLAFALYFPQQRLVVFPVPIPLPAWLFVTLYGLLELVLGVTGTEAGVAHFAHLGGMLGGALVLLWWRLQAPTRGPY
jgi:membrane associated rhomboid family serine protease